MDLWIWPASQNLRASYAVFLMFIIFMQESLLWSVPYLFFGVIEGFKRALYFSMVTYTTLGYGDVVLPERWRLLGSIEAASGIIMLMLKGYSLYPQRTLENLNPVTFPMWPLMFITNACGAIGGFHATRLPLMARCLTNEQNGRKIFYGSMIMEVIIALIWATLAMSFFHSPEELNHTLGNGGPAQVVNTISTTLLGGVGGILAIVGVVVLPISSGDTAFRSARLIIADFLGLSQKENIKRLMIASE